MVELLSRKIRKLKQFKPGVQNRIIAKGLRESAKMVRKAVVRNIRTRRQTGAMSKGLTTKRKKFRDGVGIIVTSPSRQKLKKNNPSYDPKNKASYYPGSQEFGTKHVLAQNAYRRGFTQAENAARSTATVRIWTEIKKELAKR